MRIVLTCLMGLVSTVSLQNVSAASVVTFENGQTLVVSEIRTSGDWTTLVLGKDSTLTVPSEIVKQTAIARGSVTMGRVNVQHRASLDPSRQPEESNPVVSPVEDADRSQDLLDPDTIAEIESEEPPPGPDEPD